MAIYYYDGTTLGNSTAIFTDAGMSACAPDGFYSDGVIVRELLVCTLLPEQVCGTCATPCGGNISGNGDQGIYLLDLDAGGTASDIGAVVIKFNPQNIPDGIRATYNNVVYNKLSSPIDGYHASTNPSSFTYVGRTSDDCGISGTTYPNLIEKTYVNGAFVDYGNTQSITVASGDVSLGTSSPGNCIMVVPKTLASPTLINLEFVGPCSQTAWSISVSCPTALPSFISSVKAATGTQACGLTLNQTYYFASHTSAATPAIFDWVFGDSFGMNVLENDFYKVGNNFIQVQNGLVVAIGTCSSPPPPPTEYIYLSTVISLCYDFCDGTNYYISTQKTTVQNHSYANIALGDEIVGSVIVDGFYAYAGSQTYTDTGIYKIMQVENNEVMSIWVCDAGYCTVE